MRWGGYPPLHGDDLSRLLSLAGVEATYEQCADWTNEQNNDAEEWAHASILHAADDSYDVPERPSFLPDSSQHGIPER
jgi:hypothetical protein